MNFAIDGDREIQQQISISSNAVVIDYTKFINRFNLIVLIFVIKPTRTNGNIHFCRKPFCTVFFSKSIDFQVGLTCDLRRIAPICGSCKAFFVADPTNCAIRSAKYHSRWISGKHSILSALIIIVVIRVNRACLVGSTIITVAAIGAVKPEFEQRSVIVRKLVNLLVIGLNILRISIISVVSIPRRAINSEFQTIFATSVRKLFHQIPFPIFIRRFRNIVIS